MHRDCVQQHRWDTAKAKCLGGLEIDARRDSGVPVGRKALHQSIFQQSVRSLNVKMGMVRPTRESCTRTKMTIISIVDDDRIVREAMADLLRSLGYEATTFESAEDFLESCNLAQTSCLITDLHMPGLDGLELQSRLIAQGHQTPIIFITAYPEERFRKRAMNAGAAGFLNKPFTEDALINCVESALNSSTSSSRHKPAAHPGK